jgi:hypothetical protein
MTLFETLVFPTEFETSIALVSVNSKMESESVQTDFVPVRRNHRDPGTCRASDGAVHDVPGSRAASHGLTAAGRTAWERSSLRTAPAVTDGPCEYSQPYQVTGLAVSLDSHRHGPS